MRRGARARWRALGRGERLVWSGALVVVGALAVLGAGVVLVGEGHTSGQVDYLLAWDDAGVQRLDDGGWSVVTGDGTEVVVTSGSLTTAEITMVTCPHGHGLWERVQRLFGADPAGAGHAQDHDPVLASVDVVEDLAALEVADAAEVDAEGAEPSYCEAQTALAGGSAAEVLAGEAAPTLRLEGTVAGEPFLVETTTAWGAQGELRDEAGEATSAVLDAATPIELTLVRSASGLADVLAAAEDPSDEATAIELLRAIADGSRFEVAEP